MVGVEGKLRIGPAHGPRRQAMGGGGAGTLKKKKGRGDRPVSRSYQGRRGGKGNNKFWKLDGWPALARAWPDKDANEGGRKENINFILKCAVRTVP